MDGSRSIRTRDTPVPTSQCFGKRSSYSCCCCCCEVLRMDKSANPSRNLVKNVLLIIFVVMYCHRTPPPDTTDANLSLRLTTPIVPILCYTVNERSREKRSSQTLSTLKLLHMQTSCNPTPVGPGCIVCFSFDFLSHSLIFRSDKSHLHRHHSFHQERCFT